MVKKVRFVRVIVVSLVFFGLLAGMAWSQEKRMFEGVTISIGVLAAGNRGPISGALYYWRDEWEKQTGAKLNIIEVPIAQIREKIFTDLFTGGGTFDGFDGPIWITGDLLAGDYIYDIEQWYDDPRFPKWNKDDVVPGLADVVNKWGNTWYYAPNDYDCHTLNYRRDILLDEKWQSAFEKEKGYRYNVPPRTWEELADIAEFFNGKDWNNDGEPDYGISMALQKGQQAGWHFISLASPYMMVPSADGKPTRYKGVLWFDPETMEPLINQPGFLRALEMLIRLYKAGNPAQLGWELGGAWNEFLDGKSIFNYGYGDLGPLAQDEERSKVKGKLGCSILPGTLEVWDREKGEWLKLSEPNFITNAIGPSWSIMIFKQTKHPEVVYHLAAFHASKEISFWNVTHGFTGINLGQTFQFFTNQNFGDKKGEATIEDWVKQGWDKNDAEEYVNAFYENYTMSKTILPQLRIPGMQSYYDALDDQINAAVSGQVSPEVALQRVYDEWQKITKQLGVEKQLEYYREAIGYKK